MNYQDIKKLSAETGINAEDLIALAPDNDPFYAGIPGRTAWAQWYLEMWTRFGSASAGKNVRRLHYVLISQHPRLFMPDGKLHLNTNHCSKRLGSASLAARYLRLVPAGNFIDMRNPQPIINAMNKPVAGAVIPTVEIASSQPDLDYDLPTDLDIYEGLISPYFDIPGGALSDGQPFLVEIWAEKSTQSDILDPLCQRLAVNYVPGKGETSEILARDAVERAIEAGRPMRILYISDHDPGGRSMPVGLARKVEFTIHEMISDAGLDGLDVTLEPIMLLPEQCVHYQLPRVPIKDSERRASKFEERFGEGATELDALEALHPGEFAKIVEREVCRYIDPTLTKRSEQAYRDIWRRLENIAEDVKSPYAEQLEAINDRFVAIKSKLQEAIDAAREESADLEAEAVPVWEAITDDLEEVTPELEPHEVPTARDADPVPDPLFDSRRSYLEQIDSYRRWQRR